MSFNYNKYSAYHHANETMSHVDQIIMLYGHAISYINQSKEAINAKNFEQRYCLVEKTLMIINGLHDGLDFEAGGQVADALDQHYDSIEKLLLSLQIDNSLETCDEIIKNLKVIQNSWQRIADQTKHKAPSSGNPDIDEHVDVKV